MMLGFLEGGLSSSGWAGGRHLHGWKVGTPFFFSATGREEKEKRETCPVKLPRGVCWKASESVLSRLRGMR